MCKCPRRYKNKGTGGARTKDQRRSRSPARPTTNDSVTIAGPLEDEDFVLIPGLVTEEENGSAFQSSQDGSPHEADQEARSVQDEPTTEDLLRRSKRRHRPQVSFSERNEKLERSSSPILGSRRVRRKCRKSCSLTGSRRDESNKLFTPESLGLPAVSSSSKNIPHAQPRRQACMPFPASAPFHHYDSAVAAAAAQDCWIIPNIPVTFSTLPFLTKKKVDHRAPKIAPGEAPSNSLLSEVSSSSSYMEDLKPAVVALPPINNTKGSTNKSSSQEEPRVNRGAAADSISFNNYSKWYCSATSLGPNFCPGPHDVICARGKRTYNHPGNERFRSLVQDAYPQYKNAKSKSERSSIVSGIVNQVRRFMVAPPDAPAKQDATNKAPVLLGGFVKREADGNWIEVGETLAREKISQMMRNFVGGSEYSSSIEHKRRRKHARKANPQRLERLHQVVLSNPKVKAAVIELTNHVAHHHQQQPNQNEQASMALFHSLTQDMLSAIKADSEMLARFLQTEQDLRLEEQQSPTKKPRQRASSGDHDKEE